MASTGHARTKSATKANRPRAATKGPLDDNENPLAIRPSHVPSPTVSSVSSPLTSPRSSLVQPTPSRYASSRRNASSPGPGSGPGSPMSVQRMSPAPARNVFGGLDASLASPPPAAPKDFSFLLRPDIYQPLGFTNVPPAFRASEPDPATPLADLVSGGYFRAAAILAAQQLVGSPASPRPDPADHARIFGLLYTRLACLMLLDATPVAAQEAKVLEDLNSPYYLDERGAHVVPWELRVLHVRLMALSFTDPRRAVMSYYELAREARLCIADAMAAHDNSARELWKGRLAELGIKVAGALIEMDDLAGAAAHLASMAKDRDASLGSAATPASRRLDMARALLWLQLGDADEARAVVAPGGGGSSGGGAADGGLAPRIVSALGDMADGEYEAALATWQELHEDAPADEMVSVNMAVCMVYVGRMVDGRRLLEGLVDAGYASHTLLFNLSTMYELCTDRAKTLKLGLTQRIADKGATATGGWEKPNADFKL